MTYAMIISNATLSQGICSNKIFAKASWMTCACLSFCASCLHMSLARIQMASTSLHSPLRCWCQNISASINPVKKSCTYLKPHHFVFVCLYLPNTRCCPGFQVKSLQQRCAPTSFSLQTPITAYQLNEILFLVHIDFSDVIQNVLNDDIRY